MTDQPDVPTVARELRIVLGRLIRRIREKTDAGELTRSQASALGRLERDGPATVSALARAEGIRPQSMTAIVAALTEAGLVAGTPDPDDGRKTIVAATDTAREMFRTDRLTREDWLTTVLADRLTPDEIAHLATSVELLERLARA